LIAYGVTYTVVDKHSGKIKRCDDVVDAKDINSAKRKLARRHGYKNENVIQCERINIIGYY